MNEYLAARCSGLSDFCVGDIEVLPIVEEWLNDYDYEGYDFIGWLPTGSGVIHADGIFKKRINK